MTKLISLLFSFCLLAVAFELHAVRMEMKAEYSATHQFQAEYTKLAGAVPMSQLVAIKGR